MTGLTMIMTLLLQSGATFPDAGAKDGVGMEQLATPGGGDQDIAIPNVASGKGTNPSQMPQLPPTLDAPVGDSKGEDMLKSGHDHDRRRLTDEVARVAGMLRERGQQPTPEALAREIGPDALAEYLNVDPSMLDSYGAVPVHDQPDTPSNDGVIIPPTPQ